MKVRIKKLRAVSDPKSQTPEAKEYVFGKLNLGVSVPVDYEIEGELCGEIKTGEYIKVNRTKRNGEEVSGVFQTTPVEKIHSHTHKEVKLSTANSVYVVEFLDEHN